MLQYTKLSAKDGSLIKLDCLSLFCESVCHYSCFHHITLSSILRKFIISENRHLNFNAIYIMKTLMIRLR